jgi:hypothetical protein
VSVPSDPSELRALAGRLQLHGERIADAASRATAAVESAEFEGPAADRLRDETVRRRVVADRVASEVEDAAIRLLRRAAEVEAEAPSAGLTAPTTPWPPTDGRTC